MVKFSESVIERTKRTRQYAMEHEKELEPRTVTVVVKKEDDFLSSASRPGSELIWYSDELRGGEGQAKGPSPLSYFLSSMGF